MIKNKVIITILILLLIGSIPKILRYLESKNSDNSTFTAYYEIVKQDNKVPEIQISGELKPYYKTEIYSKIDGLLEKRLVNIGDNVKKDDILAIISAPVTDSEEIMTEEEVNTNKNSIKEAQYRMNFAKDTYLRYKNAFNDGAISPQEIQEKENNYKTAEAEYKIATTRLNESEAKLKRIKEVQKYKYIRAPFDGIITKYNVDDGANIVAGGSSTSTRLFEIAEINKLRLRLDIPQSYANKIKSGDEISFFVPENPTKHYKGILSTFTKSFDDTTRTMTAEMIVENEDLQLYSGMYVKAIIPLNKNNNLIMVSNSSIITDKDGTKILTIDELNKLHYKKVIIGEDFGDLSEIISGININDKVVINYNDTLKEGQSIISKEAEN